MLLISFFGLNLIIKRKDKPEKIAPRFTGILVAQRRRQTNLGFSQLYCEWPVVVSSCNSDSGTLLKVCSLLCSLDKDRK